MDGVEGWLGGGRGWSWHQGRIERQPRRRGGKFVTFPPIMWPPMATWITQRTFWRSVAHLGCSIVGLCSSTVGSGLTKPSSVPMLNHFHDIFDKGYRVHLMARRQGRQEIDQPAFVRSDRKFTGTEKIKIYIYSYRQVSK